MKKYKRIQKNNYDTKKREPILIAILAVLIAFMDISGIPSTLLFRIQIGDIESVYFFADDKLYDDQGNSLFVSEIFVPGLEARTWQGRLDGRTEKIRSDWRFCRACRLCCLFRRTVSF